MLGICEAYFPMLQMLQNSCCLKKQTQPAHGSHKHGGPENMVFAGWEASEEGRDWLDHDRGTTECVGCR